MMSFSSAKKFVSIVMLGLSVLTVLSGCSGNGGAKAGDAAKSAATASSSDEKVTIEYWQYTFAAKVELLDKLIADFQKLHPNITVKQTNFPYEQYNEKVAALVPAGKGPDIINLYYGWLPKYVQSGYLQPLPESEFSDAKVKAEFFPFVESAKLSGKYYAIPTGVRTLALFYNKDLFAKAGLNPNNPPATWEDLVSYSTKLTARDSKGQFEVEGFTFQYDAQLPHWYRDALIYQAGGKDLSEDRRKILWNETPAGLEAFTYLVDFGKKHKVGVKGFSTDDITAFKTGKAALMVNGSFQLGGLKKDAPNLNYGIAPLPGNKVQATQASYWANGITKNVTGKKLEAATEFLKFLTSKEVQEQWVEKVGELPAKKEIALQDKYAKDEKLGPFVQSLTNSNSHYFVDEKLEKDYFVEAIDKVILNNADYKAAFDELVKKTQKLYDEYWAKQDKK